ncbi:MAG: D-alanine--D-alanine ligase [bacterium]|nr:D-alanine--D-alanine ligase [bacterium]
MLRTRVGVLRGGPSSEFDVSLATGKTVLDNLPEDLYQPIDIFIDQKGEWHRRGIPVTPERAVMDIDVIFNALHGQYGEDGKVQQLLDHFKMPYTGSGALASAVGMNKILAKKHFVQKGIKTPYYKVIEMSPNLDEKLVEIFRTFPQPSVIKPYNGGSSLGVTVARNFNEFCQSTANAFHYSPKIIIEEYIDGREGTLGLIENFRQMPIYALLPVEIQPINGRTFFDYEAKYAGHSNEICPGNFSKGEVEEIIKAVSASHEAIGGRHYSRTDFIIHPRRGIYVLEVNTLPGLTESSLIPKSLQALGIKLSEFLHHIISLAQRKK